MMNLICIQISRVADAPVAPNWAHCYHSNHRCLHINQEWRLKDCKCICFWSWQISDFLSGRSPLTINLGVGAHVMYVQLQLSAQNVADLQQHQDFRAGSRTCLPTADRTSHPDSFSQTSTTAPDSSDSTSSVQISAQTPRTSSDSTAPASAPAVSCHPPSPPHQSGPPRSTHTASHGISAPTLPTGCPHPSSPRQAATPVCSAAPTGSIPGPRSPVPASTFREVSLLYSTLNPQSQHFLSGIGISLIDHYHKVGCICKITISEFKIPGFNHSTRVYSI